LQTHRLCESLPLGELSQDAVAEYLRSRFSAHRFPAEFARVIHQRTDGNPLFMISVLDDLVTRGGIAVEDDGWVLKADATDVALGMPERIRQCWSTGSSTSARTNSACSKRPAWPARCSRASLWQRL